MRYLSIFFIFLYSCSTQEEFVNVNVKFELKNVNSVSLEDAEANVEILNVQGSLDEVGIVWANKPQPSYSDFSTSSQNVQTDVALDLNLKKLTLGQTYYVRAYWKQGQSITYSKEEITFKHSFDKQWFREDSPKLETNQYIASDIAYFSVSRGGFRYRRVDKTTNLSQESAFFPNFGRWDVSFVRFENPIVPMVYNPFYCDISKPSPKATIIGGGYNKKPNGDKFYSKTFKFDGVTGYKWDPDYAGKNTQVSAFGIEDRAYVIENVPEGNIWFYNYNTLKWSLKAKVPTNIEGSFKAASDLSQAFVLHEPSDPSIASAFYEFDEAKSNWIKKATFPGENRKNGSFFEHKGKFYYGIGQSKTTNKGLRDIWVYSPDTDTWAKFTDYPGIGSINVTAVSFNNQVYFGFGQKVSVNTNGGEIFSYANDYWIYNY